MVTIRVVGGRGTGPTELAARDAALVDAGVGNYNLVGVSSVVPESASVTVAETAPDLGPVGARLTVVEALATTARGGPASAVLGWTRRVDGGPGLIYEAAGDDPPATLERRVRRGLEAGMATRGWTAEPPRVRVESVAADTDPVGAAVVLATYGRATPIE